MQKVKIEKEVKNKSLDEIEHYYKYNGHPMVEFKTGLKLGKKKITTILANVEELKKFVAGEYDEEIKNLEEGEGLKP